MAISKLGVVPTVVPKLPVASVLPKAAAAAPVAAADLLKTPPAMEFLEALMARAHIQSNAKFLPETQALQQKMVDSFRQSVKEGIQQTRPALTAAVEKLPKPVHAQVQSALDTLFEMVEATAGEGDRLQTFFKQVKPEQLFQRLAKDLEPISSTLHAQSKRLFQEADAPLPA